MPRPQKCKLPKQRTQYFVGEPVVVMSLAKVEMTYELLMRWAQRDKMGSNERNQLDVDMKALMLEHRQEVKHARQYYKINSSRPVKPAPDDSL
ncbi:hypothetical protein [Fibrivirga algicola]|uniref:Transposase n=1 Tax=Fibrivirga algicola TaxID=2950420 RepID=A0ABX0QDQ1_9BACT|nr:hypothetical protein [Fibrivirga algicola]NID09381.1 hypothetical protein [Fibrivirga algicola]